MVHRRIPRLAAVATLGAFTALATAAPALRAQASGDSLSRSAQSHLGLDAIGAATFRGGWSTIENNFHAWQVGTSVDFGYMRSRHVRLVADAAYLLTLPHREYVIAEGKTYRDVFRDLSAHLSIAVHPISPTARVSPYVAAGVGVHVLSSSFGSLTIDTRYNTNNFGLREAIGVRIGVGASGRRALNLEVESLQARNVRRVAVVAGIGALFNDLVRR